MIFTHPGHGHHVHWPKQIVRIMKLCILIMTTLLLQVSAVTKAQITLSEKNAPFEKVIRSIKKQSGYDFFYNGHDMQKAHPVTLNLRNVSIEEALKACFEGQELSYTIDEKTVVIKEKTLSFMNKVAQIFQSIEVKGRVVGDKGSPLPGASIKVKGTDVTTISNSDGEFSLSRVDEKAVLVISFIGYESKELNAAKDLGNIVMDLTTGRLEEIAIVSTGYADGYFRAGSSNDGTRGAEVIVAGKRCPVAGRISMDLMAIDVTDLDKSAVRRGHMVTLIGEGITVDELAHHFGTIGYEVLTSLGKRYARVYKGGAAAEPAAEPPAASG